MINKRWLLEEYEEILKEKDELMKKLRLAFLIVIMEDTKLLEDLLKDENKTNNKKDRRRD